MEQAVAIIWILSAAASGCLTYVIADSKGYKDWFFVGLLLGPLGVLAAAGLGDRITQKHLRRLAAQAPELPEEEKPPSKGPSPMLD